MVINFHKDSNQFKISRKIHTTQFFLGGVPL
jgi:hypothetical protein